MSSTSLDDLCSCMKPLAQELFDQTAAAGIPVRVIDTLRTPAEQAVKIATGVSWTQRSLHLPQPPEMKSLAIDVCPLSILNSADKNWDPTSPLWLQIGLIGESLGLEWGGRWTHLNGGRGDPSHFQFVRSSL